MSYYRCSECGNKIISISFEANYTGTVKIGSIDEIRKEALQNGISSIVCCNCGEEIELDERAERAENEKH